MRYAVISDIHANLEALEAVLGRIRQQEVDQILCCGDILGYYADPNACMALLKVEQVRSIVGNHDLAAIGEKDLAAFWSVAKKAIQWTQPRLQAEHRAALREMPRILAQDDLLLFHGALHIEQCPEDHHLVTEADLLATVEALASHRSGARLGFCGHTHRPYAYEYRQGTLVETTASSVEISENAHYLFNPGSVGQSRDKDERASYLVYDDAQRLVSFYRVEYDRKTTLRKAKQEGLLPDPIFIKHLKNAVRKVMR